VASSSSFGAGARSYAVVFCRCGGRQQDGHVRYDFLFFVVVVFATTRSRVVELHFFLVGWLWAS